MEPLASRVGLTSDHYRTDTTWRHNVRRASDLMGFVRDTAALQAMVEAGDPVVYETFEAPVPEEAGHLLYGITVIRPGKIGSEYFMTKGHYHVVRESAEIYFGLAGHGLLLMQDEQGDFRAVPIGPGAVVYVPPGWAHRSVNTGVEPLVMLYAFPAHAGHDYAT
ncbi:MAG: cupin domain-containing protein, partial [Firmicutes bacterium]|nr:cupin domain-containing protein [Bacillota bacterium]